MSVIDHLSTIIGAPAVAAAGTNNIVNNSIIYMQI